MAVTYTYQVGETFRLPLVLVEGDSVTVSNVRANLKLTIGNKQMPPMTAPIAATFDVVPVNEGWILELPANESALLKPGMYAVNTAMEIGGYTHITDPAFVRVEPSTTL